MRRHNQSDGFAIIVSVHRVQVGWISILCFSYLYVCSIGKSNLIVFLKEIKICINLVIYSVKINVYFVQCDPDDNSITMM